MIDFILSIIQKFKITKRNMRRMYGNRLYLYSEVYRFDENDEEVNLSRYCQLLEPVGKEWYGDKNLGLAQYLDGELKRCVKKILYYYESGHICFEVHLAKEVTDETIINYEDREITLFEAVCDYLSGQLSDGWGENGIILNDWANGDIFHALVSWQLYERDYKAVKKLAKEAGEEYPEYAQFEDYPAFKEIKF